MHSIGWKGAGNALRQGWISQNLIFLLLVHIIFYIVFVTKMLPVICWLWWGYVDNLLAEGSTVWELNWDSSVIFCNVFVPWAIKWGLSSVCKANGNPSSFFPSNVDVLLNSLVALPLIHRASHLCSPSSLFYYQRSSENHFLSYVFPSLNRSQSFRYLIPQPRATDRKHKFISFTLNERGEHKYHYIFPMRISPN